MRLWADTISRRYVSNLWGRFRGVCRSLVLDKSARQRRCCTRRDIKVFKVLSAQFSDPTVSVSLFVIRQTGLWPLPAILSVRPLLKLDESAPSSCRRALTSTVINSLARSHACGAEAQSTILTDERLRCTRRNQCWLGCALIV